eukprot:10487877-Lingulodinium_polyedra.AAC.1
MAEVGCQPRPPAKLVVNSGPTLAAMLAASRRVNGRARLSNQGSAKAGVVGDGPASSSRPQGAAPGSRPTRGFLEHLRTTGLR